MSRRVKCWSVEYTEVRECELGYEHKVGAVLTGLETKTEAQEEAKRLKGRIQQDWYTPELTDDEIKQLNDEGVPVARSPYGLTFTGIACAFSSAPSSLDSIRSLYKHSAPPVSNIGDDIGAGNE